MKIGGVTPLSLVDYPGKPAIVIFTDGCNLRCPFCHNGELALGGRTGETVSPREVLDLLDNRSGRIDAVCITGGEPTIHAGLATFAGLIKARGFSVKLDTNGSRPQVLWQLLQEGLVDYVAMDIKSSARGYRQATGGKLDFATVAQAVAVVKEAQVPYELRTTCVPGLVEFGDLAAIVKALRPLEHFVLQQFRSGKTLDPSYTGKAAHRPEWFEEATKILRAGANAVSTRGV